MIGEISYSLKTHDRTSRLFPKLLTFVLLLLSLVGFSRAAKVEIPFTTLSKGQYSGVREPLKVIIQTQDEWVALWTGHSSIKANPSPPPYVDFATEIVVGVFVGERSTGGYEVEITRAERTDSAFYIYYRQKSPAPDTIVTQALTQPYHLIKVTKYDIPQVFLREDS